MPFWIIIALTLVLSATGLTFEIAAGRILAPFFGTSLVTWTTVIATVLAGFSLGNAVGGFVAERSRPAAIRTVRHALIATAVLSALTPTVLGLVYAAGARGTGGMVLGVVVAFFPASVLVSIPTPLLAKLAVEARPGRAGSSLGLVLAAGSTGAILGAILAGFVALPLAGSAATFAGCAVAALACVPFFRASSKNHDDPDLPMFGIAMTAGLIALSLSGGAACRYESGLSCIDVQREGAVVRLYSDRTQQAAEKTVPTDADLLDLPYTRTIWDRMDRDLGAAPSVLFIGGGGYTLPTKLLSSRPQARAVTVEIDPLITRVVQAHMPRAGAMIDDEGFVANGSDGLGDRRLEIVHADGRVFINETDRNFDAAVMDAFSSGAVPAHLTTRETYDRLRDIVDGPIYVNLIDRPDGPLVRGVHAVLTDVFTHVDARQGDLSSRGHANIILTASQTPILSRQATQDGYQSVTISPARAFTDDRGWVGHR